LHVVVPVKPLRASKSRLSGLLGPRDREELASAMLADVLSALSEARCVEAVLVVSPDEKVRAISERFGARFLPEPRPLGLDGAVELATRWCIKEGAGAVLVLHADVPLVSGADLEFLALARKAHQVVLAPSRDLRGTNALLRSPPDVLETSYGPGSFRRHLSSALAKGLRTLVYYSRTLALDIDGPDDLRELAKRGPSGRRSVRVARELLARQVQA